jgi:hypothetical protein
LTSFLLLIYPPEIPHPVSSDSFHVNFIREKAGEKWDEDVGTRTRERIFRT